MNASFSARHLLLPLAAFLLGGAALSAQTPLRSDSLRFAVTIPANYALRSPELQPIASNDAGENTIEMTTWTAMGRDQKSVCLIAVMDYPREMYEAIQARGDYKASTAALLDTAVRKGMESLNKAKILSKKEVILGEATGRTVRLQTTLMGRKVYGRFDYYIVENRLFQVGYLSANKKALDTPPIAAFFSSFGITPQALE